MKGILGRKIGMTQVFTDHGISIPVTIVEAKPNIVTAVFSQEKDGYVGTQLGVQDVKKHLQNKPEKGHFAKSNTVPKKFVKEIRDMDGHDLGATIDVSIFTVGELVDATGTGKGKGFAGAIKRHNQSIGPKSHGGGGGSQPQRQTGSLGDISGNKVVKGMTMPGQMGNVRRTQQNLEIISIDVENNIILIKGSIPGPRKSFVIIEEAVKGLPSKTPTELVNVKEAEEKNALLESAKKAGADVNTDMSVEDMKAAINAASESKAAEAKATEAKDEADKISAEADKVEEKVEEAKEEVKKAEESGDAEAIKVATEKTENLEKQAETVEAKAEEAKAEAKEVQAEAAVKEAEAEKLQVAPEPEAAEEEPKAEEAKGDA